MLPTDGTLKIASDKTTVLNTYCLLSAKSGQESDMPLWEEVGKTLGLDWEDVFLKVKILNMFAAPWQLFLKSDNS